MPNGERVRFYGLAEIGRPMDERFRPPAGREARCAEVVAAHLAWEDEHHSMKDGIGLSAAEDAAAAASWDIERATIDTMPATLAGLAAKARWATTRLRGSKPRGRSASRPTWSP